MRTCPDFFLARAGRKTLEVERESRESCCCQGRRALPAPRTERLAAGLAPHRWVQRSSGQRRGLSASELQQRVSPSLKARRRALQGSWAQGEGQGSPLLHFVPTTLHLWMQEAGRDAGEVESRGHLSNLEPRILPGLPAPIIPIPSSLEETRILG